MKEGSVRESNLSSLSLPCLPTEECILGSGKPGLWCRGGEVGVMGAGGRLRRAGRLCLAT